MEERDRETAVSADQLREEEDVIRRHLKAVRKDGTQWTGYVDGDDTLRELEGELAAINVSFKTEVPSNIQVEKSEFHARVMPSRSVFYYELFYYEFILL